MKLIDTTVFIYAAGRDHPLREPCATLVRGLPVAGGQYAIDAEVLQEVLHLYGSRGERAKGARMVDAILRLFPEPIAIGGAELRLAAHMFGAHPRLSARDAIHAAVAVRHAAEAIISADRDFDGVAGVRRLDPADAASGGRSNADDR